MAANYGGQQSQQQLEDGQLLLAAATVEGELVFSHVEVGEKLHFMAQALPIVKE